MRLYRPDETSTVEADRLREGNGAPMPAYPHGSFMVQQVCSELIGQPWDDLSVAFLSGVNPSGVRVIPYDGLVKSDARSGRVTVHLRKDGITIDSVEQEVSVGLPSWVENGHDLHCRMKARQ